MNTRHILSNATRLLVAAACVVTASGCGSDLLRTGRSPLILVINSITGASGSSPGTFTTTVQSDVQVLVTATVNGVEVQVPTLFNDLVRLNLSAVAKDQSGLLPGGSSPPTSALNNITVTRYRVTFRRSDGHNTPGVDVPFGFDGAVTATISAGGSGDVTFDLVRHQAKLDPPLRNLIGLKGLRFITTVADITIWGRDQNGNEVTATGSIDVQFSDFPDPS